MKENRNAEANKAALFEQKEIRRTWQDEKWYFSVVDVVSVLTDSADGRKYWNKLKQRLSEEGNETVTNCHQFKMPAADGKMHLTDCADTEQLLRIIQSIPSPKAEPFKRWLAAIGAERIREISDPEIAAQRAQELYRKKGYRTIGLRCTPVESRRAPQSGGADRTQGGGRHKLQASGSARSKGIGGLISSCTPSDTVSFRAAFSRPFRFDACK